MANSTISNLTALISFDTGDLFEVVDVSEAGAARSKKITKEVLEVGLGIEIGFWNMLMSFGGASVGLTYHNNTGTYTKIGRQVTVNGFLYLNSIGSSTGVAEISGLPYTSDAGLGFSSAVSLQIQDISFADFPMASVPAATAKIALSEITNAGTRTTLDNTNYTSGSYMIVSATYFI
ncbi:MAG: hypothetical protein O2887_10295 [Bacteroidetes bacterium]|nr:hypothetical protein [Bacteroidota bacterium]